jgi:hypothetical protein
MTRRMEDLDDILAQRQASRLERLLGYIDTAIVPFGRAVGRALIEGLAAYAESQFFMPVGASFDESVDDRAERMVVPPAQASLAQPSLPLRRQDELPGDFEDLQGLIASIQAKT